MPELTRLDKHASPAKAGAQLPTGSKLGPGLRRGGVSALGTVAFALLAVTPAAAQVVKDVPTPYPHAIAAGMKAIFLCEGLFAAGRTEAQVAETELRGIYPEYDSVVPSLYTMVDRRTRSVTVSWTRTLPARRAVWAPRTGCTLAPPGATLTTLPAYPNAPIPAPADPRPWPMGDAGIAPAPNEKLDRIVARAVEGGFGAGSVTTGVVVLRDGRVIAERYPAGFGPFVPNRTWSVAKSVAGTLVGIAAAQLKLDPRKPAPIPEWRRRSGDPRARIMLDNLLRMASGLHSDTAGNRSDAIYFGGTAVTDEATGWSLEAAPGSRFRYANNDILLAVRAVRAAMNDDARYASWPRTTLLTPLGMQHTEVGTDWQGHFVLSSQIWTTARDLARLGELWRNDGMWQGRRIMPAGWVRYMITPSGPQPAEGPGYGATMWLFGPKQGLPLGSYAAQGNRGQSVMVIPSERLVIVRRGEDPTGTRFDISRFSADVIEALK